MALQCRRKLEDGTRGTERLTFNSFIRHLDMLSLNVLNAERAFHQYGTVALTVAVCLET